jgi:hypothetical protein
MRADEGSPFRRIKAPRAPPTDIEGLFKELRDRSPEIKSLYSQQADIVRSYFENHLSSPDVSLELPTGSGKTLVGLLIGEYRRRFNGERILYLCPTRQLVSQVVRHAREYGIDARGFVGSKHEYNPEDVTGFRTARIIAVATYSGLFNSSPGLHDPQTIILDDAHDAETYIASLWSLTVSRETDPGLYSSIVSTFRAELPPEFVSTLEQATRPSMPPRPEMVPFFALTRHVEALRALLNAHAPGPDVPEIYFKWAQIRDSLAACHVYLNWDEVLIRPYIPPTQTHSPFARAKQRVYMSATLGLGGELERSSGMPRIARIPTPKTYQSRGVGRRLFLFPDYAHRPSEYEGWIAKRLTSPATPRTLVLCPTRQHITAFRNQVLAQVQGSVRELSAADIEESLEPFAKADRAALVLSNRYDGLDLPQEDCRQIVLYGLPTGTNLQEAFLDKTLGLEVLLRERVKTRITQGTGRCTRSDTDYAAVIVVGRTLLDFCVRTENQVSLHPELRAEMQFAIEQKARELEHLDAMMNALFSRSDDWRDAEANIAALTAEEAPATSPSAQKLAIVVAREVEFGYALWRGDYSAAVEKARYIVDSLSGDELSAYRAFWCYMVAYAAHLASGTDANYSRVRDDFLNRSVAATRTIAWYIHARRISTERPTASAQVDDLQVAATEGILTLIADWGEAGPNFQQQLDQIASGLESDDPDKFDPALTSLGTMLGYNAWKPPGRGAPDSVWKLGESVVYLFEAKSNETPDDPVAPRDCLQANGHVNWAGAQVELAHVPSRIPILVTHRQTIDPLAVPQAEGLYYVSIEEVRELFATARTMLEGARARLSRGHDAESRTLVANALDVAKLNHQAIATILTRRRVADLSVASAKPDGSG